MIGQLLTGRYLILEKLGTGGFSETYLARDKYLPHHPLCVVKCLKQFNGASLSLEVAQQFFSTEARLLEQLGRHHSQIPTLLAFCQVEDQAFLVQEYIEGERLADWLSDGRRRSVEATIALLAEVLPILEYLHSHQVIHRDISPSNLICQRNGKVTLIDFGAACAQSEGQCHLTSPTEEPELVIGTPGYMPDEQHLGLPQLNSDLYALGILAVQLLTGVQPQDLHVDLISGELDWHPYLPESTVDPKLVAILDRMVQSNFRDRYQRPAEALQDLQTLQAATRPDLFQTALKGQHTHKLWVSATLLLMLAGVGEWYLQTHPQAATTLFTTTQQLLSKAKLEPHSTVPYLANPPSRR